MTHAHLAVVMFITGSVCILVSTTAQAERKGEAKHFTRIAAVCFIFGSLLLW